MHPVADFETLHSDLLPRIQAYLRRFVGADEAEDLAQEVFIKVHQGLDGFRGESRLSTWVFQIATNLALDRVRSAPHRHALREEAVNPDGALPSDSDHGKEPIQEEMCQCIRDMVDELPLGYRTILYLSELKDLDLGEIAALLGVTRGAAKIRLHRARRMLRDRMEQGCQLLVDDRGELGCDPKPVPSEGAAPSQKAKGGRHVRIHRNPHDRQDPGRLRPV